MSKHAPGPWQLCEDSAGHHREVIDNEGSTVLAETEYGQETPTNHADWPLIAAAPDLLEALKAVLDLDADAIAHGQARIMARRAIAKAEGRA